MRLGPTENVEGHPDHRQAALGNALVSVPARGAFCPHPCLLHALCPFDTPRAIATAILDLPAAHELPVDGQAAYIVLSGCLRLDSGPPDDDAGIVELCQPGHCIGLAELFGANQRGFGWTTAPTRLCRIPRSRLLGVLEPYPRA